MKYFAVKDKTGFVRSLTPKESSDLAKEMKITTAEIDLMFAGTPVTRDDEQYVIVNTDEPEVTAGFFK